MLKIGLMGFDQKPQPSRGIVIFGGIASRLAVIQPRQLGDRDLQSGARFG